MKLTDPRKNIENPVRQADKVVPNNAYVNIAPILLKKSP